MARGLELGNAELSNQRKQRVTVSIINDKEEHKYLMFKALNVHFVPAENLKMVLRLI